MNRITFSSPQECYLFGVGDRLSGAGGEIVTDVNFDRCEITTAPATWYRRFYYWCRARLLHARWWLRCTWADVWGQSE